MINPWERKIVKLGKALCQLKTSLAKRGGKKTGAKWLIEDKYTRIEPCWMKVQSETDYKDLV